MKLKESCREKNWWTSNFFCHELSMQIISLVSKTTNTCMQLGMLYYMSELIFLWEPYPVPSKIISFECLINLQWEIDTVVWKNNMRTNFWYDSMTWVHHVTSLSTFAANNFLFQARMVSIPPSLSTKKEKGKKERSDRIQQAAAGSR